MSASAYAHRLVLQSLDFAEVGDYSRQGTAAVQVDPLPLISLPFPDAETSRQEVWYFSYRTVFTNFPLVTSYSSTATLRLHKDGVTLLEWECSVTDPDYPALNAPAEDNLSSFSSTLTPSQPLAADVTTIEGLPAVKRIAARAYNTDPGIVHDIKMWSDAFELNLPSGMLCDVTVVSSQPNTQNIFQIELRSSAYIAALPLFAAVEDETVRISGITQTPFEPQYIQISALGFYWKNTEGEWVRVGDFSTVGGTSNIRTIEYETDGAQDIYGFTKLTNGLVTWSKIQATTEGGRNPFFVHPAGFQMSAIKSGADTKIETWTRISQKDLSSTIAGVRPIAINRLQSGEIHLVGKASDGARFYRSTDDGRTWQLMGLPFDSTYKTHDETPLFGPLDMAIATKAGKLYVRTSDDSGVTWGAPDGFTPITLPAGFKNLTVRQRTVSGEVSIVITDIVITQLESTNDGSTWSSIS